MTVDISNYTIATPLPISESVRLRRPDQARRSAGTLRRSKHLLECSSAILQTYACLAGWRDSLK
ncbi:hypothetical protein [Pseudomonas sp. GL-B-12]|uniref:hypothetical protein n=1 Tax=Pseudomonas sp. GL-B-12 TaxID=2832374 RepID=UPI001CBD0DE3|nr:hypothetical protein [Pseudomonas sp. GL-B-12]